MELLLTIRNHDQSGFLPVPQLLLPVIGYLTVQAGLRAEDSELLTAAQSGIETAALRSLDGLSVVTDLKQRSERALNGLSQEVVSGARRGFCGWLAPEKMTENLQRVLLDCHSLNELIHVIHTFATQNEETLEGLK
jgi:hypothetical protein